jgi:hypothetical protein
MSYLVALSLAFLVWMYARSRDQDMLDNVAIPVQITLGPGLVDQYDLDVPDPCQVFASFSGPPSRIRELRSLIHHGEMRVEITLTVPENLQHESRYVDTVRVDASDIRAPQGVTAVVVEGRNRIPVTLYRLVERSLPVRFNCALEDRLGPLTVEPAAVTVRGPQEILDRTRAIPTQPYSLPAGNDATPGQDSAIETFVPLVRELEGRPVRTNPGAVMVRFSLRPRQKVYELADVPVHFLCPPNFPLRPEFGDDRAGKIALRVQGPAGEEPPAIIAYIDLTGGKFKPGLYDEPIRLQLPKDFQIVQNAPRSASFKLSVLEFGPKERNVLRPWSTIEGIPVSNPRRERPSGEMPVP